VIEHTRGGRGVGNALAPLNPGWHAQHPGYHVLVIQSPGNY